MPLDEAALKADYSCGPFNSKELEADSKALLEDRLRVRFFPGAKPEGNKEAGRLSTSRDGIALFVGARETYTKGDEQFVRRATKASRFAGTHAPASIGSLPIVAGLIQKLPADPDMVALAHGWFLDERGDVLDVAVFVGANATTNLSDCRLLAAKVLNGVARGPRLLKYGGEAEQTSEVSYAKFRYRLGSDWLLASSTGIHDFAHVQFRKRGVFPNDGVTLELGLDSHPGDWASPGTEEGQRAGTLLTVPINWRLTKKGAPPSLFGAWSISEKTVGRDHAVVSLWGGTSEERDFGMRFAESIQLER